MYLFHEDIKYFNILLENNLSISDIIRGNVMLVVKNLPADAGDIRDGSLSREDPLEEAMATHSSTLAWEIPWTEEPGRLQSMRSQRVRHN